MKCTTHVIWYNYTAIFPRTFFACDGIPYAHMHNATCSRHYSKRSKIENVQNFAFVRANFCQIKLEFISFAQVHISRYFPIFTFLMLLQISYENVFTPRQKVFFLGGERFLHFLRCEKK